MRARKILITGSLLVIMTLLFTYWPNLLASFMFGSGGGRGPVTDSWETANNSFKVRVTVYEEKDPILLTRFNQVFEVAASGSDDWRELIETWTDDNHPIPRESVRYLSDRIGQVSMREMFAATTDGGENWAIWDAKIEVPNWQCCNKTIIREVQIGSSGRGKMSLMRLYNEIAVREHWTKDNGKSWRAD